MQINLSDPSAGLRYGDDDKELMEDIGIPDLGDDTWGTTIMPGFHTGSIDYPNQSDNDTDNNINRPPGNIVHDYGKGMYNSYTKKKGSKATRNNNPGNITGMSGNLLYGAVGFAHSKVGDKGDHTQLIYDTPQQGFQAMHQLAIDKYSNGPIKSEFKEWQTNIESFRQKLYDLGKAGIDINKSYASLSSEDQRKFRKIWSQHEGYRGEYY